ncbi:MAG: GtrA family protein [Bacteroidota bacterium]
MTNRSYTERAKKFVVEKIPFFLSGLVATGVNYGLYLLLVDRYLHYQTATIVAYSSSVLLNFVLQRYFVFELRRSVRSAFGLSMLVSLGGLLLDSALIYIFHNWIIFSHQEWIIKGLVTGMVFFYNFYLKRLVFEGR